MSDLLKANYVPQLSLRKYQFLTVADMSERITFKPGSWNLYSSPTGTGKSYIQLALLHMYPDGIMITPRIEIIKGMMSKLRHYCDEMNANKLIDFSWDKYKITTPIRLRNMLARGELPFRPNYLIVDECHHDIAESYQDITMYLNGVTKIGMTATPYRGTVKSTQIFHEQWGDEINVILTLKDAVEQQYCSFPEATIWPLVDDDLITVSGGEFAVNSVNLHTKDKLEALVEKVKQSQYFCSKQRLWDRPTMFSVPSTLIAMELVEKLGKAGLPAIGVTQDTPFHIRQRAFDATVACMKALVQINVISEGVDLPIRRLIDIHPTMSPVKWVQQIGRIMRPADIPPEYICCCRNLERHCYLMEGMLPSSKVKEAQEVFQDSSERQFALSKRSGVRVVGMEGLGRFTSTPVQLVNGLTVTTYHLVYVDGFKRTEYFAIIHPNNPEVAKFAKESTADPNTNEMMWGKWKIIEKFPELKGCQTAKVKELSPKQINRWNMSAQSFGLNPHIPLNNRAFQLLPVLMNTGLRLT